MTTPRVAVIAVHGVADQQPGETARAVAELLVSSAPAGVRYVSAAPEGMTLRVEPLAPQAGAQARVRHESAATPCGTNPPPRRAARTGRR